MVLIPALLPATNPAIGNEKSITLFESEKVEHPRSVLGLDGAENDQFGWAVAVHGDTAVVGARNDSLQSVGSAGSAYVFSRSNGVWQLEAKLTAFDAVPGFRFGSSVAIHGDTILVGAPGEGAPIRPDRGAVYVFARTGAGWGLQAKLTASYFSPVDGETGDEFGSSVALDASHAVIGAEFASGYAHHQGAAYVFDRNGAGWTHKSRLSPQAADEADRFGASVDLSGSSIVVGAFNANPNAGAVRGAAYVFSFDGIDWNEDATLMAADGAAGDAFGRAVNIDGERIVVGADGDDIGPDVDQGSAYVFRKQGGVWTQVQQLIAADGQASDGFGKAVALDATRAIVGAHAHALAGTVRAGAVYVHADEGSMFVHQRTFGDGDGAQNDRFGWSIALDGEVLVVGAFGGSIYSHPGQGSVVAFHLDAVDPASGAKLTSGQGGSHANFGQGVSISGNTALVAALHDEGEFKSSVYVLQREGGAWNQQARLLPDSWNAFEIFGYDVALDDDTAVVGECESERVVVFTRIAGAWTESARLRSADGMDDDRFGCSVAIAGDTIVVGAFEAPAGGFNGQGAAYVFVNDGNGWKEQAKLIDGDLIYEFFGEDVAIFGDTVLVGALGEREPLALDQTGAVNVFRRVGTAWTSDGRLTAPDVEPNKSFGDSVSLSGDYALIGAPGDGWSANERRGAAYLFKHEASGWKFLAKLKSGDGGIDDGFGDSVALDGTLAVVGAPGHDLAGKPDAGAAYLFLRSGHQWQEIGKMTASDSNSGGNFGMDVASSAGVVIVGTPKDDGSTIHGNFGQGAIYSFDFAASGSDEALFGNGFE